MMHSDVLPPQNGQAVDTAAERAVRAIPPAWPLASSVAVNPFLGQAGEGLSMAGARLARVAGAPVTLPRRWFREQITRGVITDADLAEALGRSPEGLSPETLAALEDLINERTVSGNRYNAQAISEVDTEVFA